MSLLSVRVILGAFAFTAAASASAVAQNSPYFNQPSPAADAASYRDAAPSQSDSYVADPNQSYVAEGISDIDWHGNEATPDTSAGAREASSETFSPLSRAPLNPSAAAIQYCRESRPVVGPTGAAAGTMCEQTDGSLRLLVGMAAAEAARTAPSRLPQRAGTFCREYQETVLNSGEPRAAYGTACWQTDGSWRISAAPTVSLGPIAAADLPAQDPADDSADAAPQVVLAMNLPTSDVPQLPLSSAPMTGIFAPAMQAPMVQTSTVQMSAVQTIPRTYTVAAAARVAPSAAAPVTTAPTRIGFVAPPLRAAPARPFATAKAVNALRAEIRARLSALRIARKLAQAKVTPRKARL